jgi:Domain of unknown function (DUF4386)
MSTSSTTNTIRTTASTTSATSNKGSGHRLLGWTMIAFGLVTSVAIGVLSAVFEFPDVLRRPGGEVLALYAKNANVVRPTYWLLGMTGLVLIGIAVELGRFLTPFAEGPARLVSGFGVATGVFWSLGYTRWPIAVPYLSDMYQTGDPAKKERAAELYGLLNRYAGMTVGEHLGFITMGVFAVALAVGLRRGGVGPRWLLPVGVFGGVLIAITSFEQYNPDLEILGALNGLANTVWFLWMIAIGVVLLRRSSGRKASAS